MRLTVNQRSTKVVLKVQAWYAFWYAWFGSHDILSLYYHLKIQMKKDEIRKGQCTTSNTGNVTSLS
jgi:hypothetical protein